jgi:hypothetical protein
MFLFVLFQFWHCKFTYWYQTQSSIRVAVSPRMLDIVDMSAAHIWLWINTYYYHF